MYSQQNANSLSKSRESLSPRKSLCGSSVNQTSLLGSEADDCFTMLKDLGSLLQKVSDTIHVPSSGKKSMASEPSDGNLSLDNVRDRIWQQLHSHESLGDLNETLKTIGDAVVCSTKTLQRSVEEHMIGFYSHLRRKAHDETTLYGAPLHTLHSQSHVATPSTSAKTESPRKTDDKDTHADPRVLALSSLGSYFHVQLLGAIQVTGATRAAAYVLDSVAGERSPTLRRFSEVNGSVLPPFVPLASASTIGTLVSHNIAINVSGVGSATRASQSHGLNVKNFLAIPFGDGLNSSTAIGCIVVADTQSGGAFGESDEIAIASTCTAVESVVRVYGPRVILGTAASPNTDGSGIVVPSLRPVVEKLLESMKSGLRSLQVTPLGKRKVDALIADPPKIKRSVVVLRSFDGNTAILDRDVEASLPSGLLPPITSRPRMDIGAVNRNALGTAYGHSSIDFSSAVTDAGSHISSMNQLWRNSLENVTQLRRDLEESDVKIAFRDEKLSVLELEIRSLRKLYTRLLSDARRIKSLIPIHVAQQFSQLFPVGSVGEDDEMPLTATERSIRTTLENNV